MAVITLSHIGSDVLLLVGFNTEINNSVVFLFSENCLKRVLFVEVNKSIAILVSLGFSGE